VIKDDLLAMFHDFHKDSLDLFSLNFGIITLIPKLRMPLRFSNIDRFVSTMLVSRFLLKLELTG
jgi:hypothetical protein